jgi:hypothetical protein
MGFHIHFFVQVPFTATEKPQMQYMMVLVPDKVWSDENQFNMLELLWSAHKTSLCAIMNPV